MCSPTRSTRRSATRPCLITLGCDIPDKPQRGPAALHTLVKSEIARWNPIIKAGGADELGGGGYED
jgi:hypothetical protein